MSKQRGWKTLETRIGDDWPVTVRYDVDEDDLVTILDIFADVGEPGTFTLNVPNNVLERLKDECLRDHEDFVLAQRENENLYADDQD